MKSLQRHLIEFLEMRAAFGFKTERSRWLLTHFLAFMRTRRRAVIATELALTWAKQPAQAHPGWWAQKLAMVRVFARYVHLVDNRHEIPPVDLLAGVVSRATPLIYRATDVAKVLRAARGLQTPAFRRRTLETLVGLLAITGMRVGEAIQLKRADIDWSNQLLIVRQSKFRKSREVVLHPTSVLALRRYAAERDRFHPMSRSSTFFVSLAGTPLIYNNVHRAFARLLVQAGIRRKRARLHDLRHTFAVHTILRWHREGRNVDAWMPRLSTYLGHRNPSSTYWYLTASPELMALAARKLERTIGARS